MIKYSLRCDESHKFEAWFRSSDDYDAQSKANLLECPECGSMDVTKAIMAPAIAKSTSAVSQRKVRELPGHLREAMHRARDYVEKNYENVGDAFPEEARRIHSGEAEERGIYGKATVPEVKELVEEGVPVVPLPGPTLPTPKLSAPIDKKKIN